MNALPTIDMVHILISCSAVITGVLMARLRQRKGIALFSTLAYATCLGVGGAAWLVLTRMWASALADGLMILLSGLAGLLPAFVFTYVLEHTSQNQRVSYWILGAPLVIPMLLLVMVATWPAAGFQVAGWGYASPLPITALEAWAWLMPVYAIGLLVGSIALLVNAQVLYLSPLRVRRMLPLLGAMLVCVLVAGLRFSGLMPQMQEFDLLLTGFTGIGVAILYANANPRQLNLIQLQRAEIFDGYDDGLIVINENDRIIDMNPAASRLLGQSLPHIYGRPVGELLANWNSLPDLDGKAEVEFRGSFFLNQQRYHLSVRVKKRRDGQGKIITLRDITERKDVYEARQLAREEMFNLLQSFFNLANSSESASAFFRDVLFQIAFTFHVESGLIGLYEPAPEPGQAKFLPVARHGAFTDDEMLPARLNEALCSRHGFQNRREPLLVGDVAQNGLAEVMHGSGLFSVLAAPLVYEEEMLGVLILARPRTNGFTPDEVVRVAIFADELASYIFFERRKKTDIAFVERQRIVGFLHDSVNQKLSSLVRDAEMIQLRRQAGDEKDSGLMLEAIISKARQALRENRLFLYELQPVELQKTGLQAALYHRLEAVEGRADINARLLVEGEIILPQEVELEVFYIVQEGLNNIIKHAAATSVLITMKRRKGSILVELEDNGQGFDSEQMGTGGLGLKNMQERARRIDGRLKITSSPGNGTRISLRIPV